MKNEERPACEAQVHVCFGVGFHQCLKPGKMQHEGKWYCGIHDPVKKREREAVKDRERDERIAANEKRDRLSGELQERADACVRALKGIKNPAAVKDVIEAAGTVTEERWSDSEDLGGAITRLETKLDALDKEPK